MTFFLPATQAGLLSIGGDVRIVLEAAPQIAIPAKISYVADVAQFTPKTVETESEREKLVFKIKAKIAPELLQKHIKKVKTGLPGVAWVKLKDDATWPDTVPVTVSL
jgi:HlyD family secretion protein